MKIALAQINPTVGDFAGNARLILDCAARAAEQSADLVIFPELAVCGYPPADLLEKSSFLARARHTLDEIASATTVRPGDSLRHRPRRRQLLPASESATSLLCFPAARSASCSRRCFCPSTTSSMSSATSSQRRSRRSTILNGQPLAITICEDAWNDKGFWPRRHYEVDPVDELMRQWATLPDPVAVHPRLILNLSASPFWQGKRDVRRKMLAAIARRHRAYVVHGQPGRGQRLAGLRRLLPRSRSDWRSDRAGCLLRRRPGIY